MAAGGGGSWKVAYADFVTAMMAFFLVMWICVQDQKIKESVAHYFLEPVGGTPIGASKKPVKSGTVFDASSIGAVPQQESIATGRGRSTYSSRGEFSLATKAVGDWLHADAGNIEYWKQQARTSREKAAWSKTNRAGTVDDAAAELLSKQLRAEVTEGIIARATGLHQDLLMASLADVNWLEIAEDLIAKNDG